MPCGDGGSFSGRTEYVYQESGKQTQRLCAVFTALEKRGWLTQTLDTADWKEAGVSKASTLAWWERHKQEDRERKAREAREREEKRAREAAREKAKKALTREERKLLGLKD